MQKDLIKVKIFQKVLGGYYFTSTPSSGAQELNPQYALFSCEE